MNSTVKFSPFDLVSNRESLLLFFPGEIGSLMVGSFQNGDVKYFCRGDDVVVVGAHAMLRIRVVYLSVRFQREMRKDIWKWSEKPLGGRRNQPKGIPPGNQKKNAASL